MVIMIGFFFVDLFIALWICYNAAQHECRQQYFDVDRYRLINKFGTLVDKFTDHCNNDGVAKNPGPCYRYTDFMQKNVLEYIR